MRNTVSRAFFLVVLLFFSVGIGRADWLVIPAPAFHSYYTDPDSNLFVATTCTSSYIYTLRQPTGGGFLYAPVNLPHGVKIQGIVFFYLDNDAGGDIKATLGRVQLSTGTYQQLFQALSGGVANWIIAAGDWSLDGGSRVVNNYGYQYALRLDFGVHSDQLRCYGVRIIYQ
jgi:hypothetical protein